jgi:hypothetical protein
MLRSAIRAPFIAIGSVCGLGYLQVWHRHWPAFAGVLVSIAVFLFSDIFSTAGVAGIVAGSPAVLFAFSYSALVACFYCALLSVVVGWFFIHVYNEPPDHFVLDVTTVQLLVLGLSVPGSVSISTGIRNFVESICDSFLICPEWLYHLAVFIVLFSAPFFFLRLFDILEFWPASYFRVNYNNNVLCCSVATLAAGIYTLLTIYGLAFIIYGLPVVDTINFLQAALMRTGEHIASVCTWLIDWADRILGEDGLVYGYLKKLGVA